MLLHQFLSETLGQRSPCCPWGRRVSRRRTSGWGWCPAAEARGPRWWKGTYKILLLLVSAAVLPRMFA